MCLILQRRHSNLRSKKHPRSVTLTILAIGICSAGPTGCFNRHWTKTLSVLIFSGKPWGQTFLDWRQQTAKSKIRKVWILDVFKMPRQSGETELSQGHVQILQKIEEDVSTVRTIWDLEKYHWSIPQLVSTGASCKKWLPRRRELFLVCISEFCSMLDHHHRRRHHPRLGSF